MQPDDLTQLQEIAPPQPVGYLPQTPAWYVVFALIMVALAWLLWRWYRRHRSNRYRREALRALEQIERNIQDAGKRPAALAALPALVKRTALAFAPREQVAGLISDLRDGLAQLESNTRELQESAILAPDQQPRGPGHEGNHRGDREASPWPRIRQ